VHARYVGEDTRGPPATVSPAGTTLAWTALPRLAAPSPALITAPATPYLFSLLYSSSRRTEGSRRDRDCVAYCDKHGAGLLPKKSLCCGGPIRPCEEKVVHRSQARPLSGMVQPSPLGMSAISSSICWAPPRVLPLRSRVNVADAAATGGPHARGMLVALVPIWQRRARWRHDPARF
jgi:hypothetical protein